MVSRVKIPFVGGSYKHPSLPFDAQQTINLFPERGGKQSKTPAIFRRTPGLDLLTTLTGSGPVRELYTASNSRCFGARAQYVQEIDTDGTLTALGTISTNTGDVSMTDNGLQLGIADGNTIKYYTFSTGVLASVTDADAPDNTPVLVFIDGYIFGFDPNAAQIGSFKHSDLNDITVWNSIDVYTAEGSPDRIVTMAALNRQLWIFGSDSFEVWYNQGGDNVTSATWARLPGTFKNIGCAAAKSVATIAAQIFWIGSSKDGENIIWTAREGYTPTRISNPAQESELASYDTITDAEAFTFEYLGHHFYVLTFQGGNKTHLYDVTEGEWVNWAYRDTNTGLQGRHRAVCHTFFNRKNYVGDYVNGKVYELSRTTYTDDGDPLVWERYFPYTESLNRRMSWYSLFIDILTGTALLTGQGSDPKLYIRWSDDGGRVFGNWHEMGMGERGDFTFRVIKRMMGQSRHRVYHVRCSEPIPMSIQDNCIAEIEVSDS